MCQFARGIGERSDSEPGDRNLNLSEGLTLGGVTIFSEFRLATFPTLDNKQRLMTNVVDRLLKSSLIQLFVHFFFFLPSAHADADVRYNFSPLKILKIN